MSSSNINDNHKNHGAADNDDAEVAAALNQHRIPILDVLDDVRTYRNSNSTTVQITSESLHNSKEPCYVSEADTNDNQFVPMSRRAAIIEANNTQLLDEDFEFLKARQASSFATKISNSSFVPSSSSSSYIHLEQRLSKNLDRHEPLFCQQCTMKIAVENSSSDVGLKTSVLNQTLSVFEKVFSLYFICFFKFL
jgi:hypothetical protein